MKSGRRGGRGRAGRGRQTRGLTHTVTQKRPESVRRKPARHWGRSPEPAEPPRRVASPGPRRTPSRAPASPAPRPPPMKVLLLLGECPAPLVTEVAAEPITCREWDFPKVELTCLVRSAKSP